jgi:hypothetical protein
LRNLIGYYNYPQTEVEQAAHEHKNPNHKTEIVVERNLPNNESWYQLVCRTANCKGLWG